MIDRQMFLKALSDNEDDTSTRLVYADWLEERGEHEEADRQRRWPAAKQWLLEFARGHFGWGRDAEESKDEADRMYTPYAMLMYFLECHVTGDRVLYFYMPYKFDDYSEELWKNFEIVSGRPAPTGQYRTKIPPFRCAC